MQSQLTHLVARELAADREARARAYRHQPRSSHPPSRVRWRAASAVTRLAWRLDPDAVRVAVRRTSS